MSLPVYRQLAALHLCVKDEEAYADKGEGRPLGERCGDRCVVWCVCNILSMGKEVDHRQRRENIYSAGE